MNDKPEWFINQEPSPAPTKPKKLKTATNPCIEWDAEAYQKKIEAEDEAMEKYLQETTYTWTKTYKIGIAGNVVHTKRKIRCLNRLEGNKEV